MAATKGQELVFELNCVSQNYAWGKVGNESEVAKLLKNGNKTFQLDNTKPYAELWMGTHPNAPSNIVSNHPKTLAEWVKENPEKLGNSVNKRFGSNLPFLFKVLSVKKALSIQAHPNKKHAEELHRRDPQNYKDPNHKPEMAIALTDFIGLCGFRPIQEIAAFAQEIPEFKKVIGPENADHIISSSISGDVKTQKDALRSSFGALMRQDKTLVEQELSALVNRVKQIAKSDGDTSTFVGDILLKISSEFPGDVGCFSVFFLNVMRLKKGEAIFLEANLPHAYLAGDCMECMACSDNVVRAGLTPKFIDTETLLQMLNYTGKAAEDNKFRPAVAQDGACCVRKFVPPIPDFAVTELELPSGESTAALPAMDSASIVICIQGSAAVSSASMKQEIQMQRGTVLFLAANETASLKIEPANGLLVYRAHAGC